MNIIIQHVVCAPVPCEAHIMSLVAIIALCCLNAIFATLAWCVAWIKSLIVQVKVLWPGSKVLSFRWKCCGGADLDTFSCRLLPPSVQNCNAIAKLWWYFWGGSINSTSRLDQIIAMPSQNKGSLHSIIAKGMKIGTDPLLPQNSH